MAPETVKYGIIGVGMMGREHLINLHHLRDEAVAVVAIADPHLPSQRQALELAHSFNWPIQVPTPLCLNSAESAYDFEGPIFGLFYGFGKI